MANVNDQAPVQAELSEAIKKEIIQKTATYTVLAFIALFGLSVAGWGFYLSNKIPEWFNGVPHGAVVAFDSSDGCPNGWVAFDDVAGRVLVGAGQGKGLSERNLREVGGNETVKLSVNQLPPLKISISGLVGQSRTDKFDAGGKNYPVLGMTSSDFSFGGTNDDIAIMPPFLAVRFCKKG